MLDNKGRLFGKINIIDLFIILVVVAALAFVFKKVLQPSIGVRQDDIVFEIYVEESPTFAAIEVAAGGKVVDDIKGVDLGIIQDVVIGDGYEYVPTSDGRLVKGYKEGYSSVKLTSLVKGEYSKDGVKIAGNNYNIGHSITIRAGKGKLFGVVSGFSRSDSNEQ
jgi:hypothetical protein